MGCLSHLHSHCHPLTPYYLHCHRHFPLGPSDLTPSCVLPPQSVLLFLIPQQKLVQMESSQKGHARDSLLSFILFLMQLLLGGGGGSPQQPLRMLPFLTSLLLAFFLKAILSKLISWFSLTTFLCFVFFQY